MAKTKYYNKDTQKWEYAETGCIPVRGTHYWVAQDLKPLHDYISSRVMATAEVCFLTISVTSNQSDKSALEGLTLSVTFPDGRAAEVEAGSVIAFTEGSVTVQFPEVAGYKRPDNLSVSYAKGSVSETATYLAEEVTVNALVDGVASSEFSYEVSGDGIVCLTGSGTSFTGVTKWLVPHGVTITITPSTVDGYTTSAVTHVASGVTGSVSVEWEEVKLGVYIEDVNGKLWTSDAWDGSVTVNGVAVCTENCRFVMSIDESIIVDGVYKKIYNDYDVDSSQPLFLEGNGAQTDFAGKSNTEKMMEVYGTSTDYAAGYCANTVFPNGQSGYLGAAGEWQAVIDNVDAIEAAMTSVGTLWLFHAVNELCWTSTCTMKSNDGFVRYAAFYADWQWIYTNPVHSYTNRVIPFTTLKMDTV